MFNVIIDTKEQLPWQFTSVAVARTIRHKLPTGDYTIEGLEDELCIERKRNVAEFATNATEARFERELKRMAQFPYAFLIFEFGLEEINAYPMGSGVPKKMWRKLKVKGPYIHKRMSEIMINDRIPIILAGTTINAVSIATSIMKRVAEKYG